MINPKLSEQQKKILEGMDKVYEKLIASKDEQIALLKSLLKKNDAGVN